MSKIVFINATIVLPDSLIENGWLICENSKIADFGSGTAPKTEDAEIIDVKGDYLAPGFIDTHVHGGGGSDFMDATEEAFQAVAEHHRSNGVTSLVATTLAGSTEETEKVLRTYCEVADKVKACNMLGVHLEGPYFSMAQKGAQDPKFIKDPDEKEVDLFLSYGCIKRWSIAPELNGAIELGARLSKLGIIASAGHTDADYEVMKVAAENGYSLMTHLYSAMAGVHIANCKRHAGAIESGLVIDSLNVETICDGVHLPAPILQLIYKCKGKDRIILTSDAMRGAGLPENTITKLGSLVNGQDVLIKNSVANRMDMKAFAGSVASGNRLLRTELNATGIPMWEAVGMLTVNPARLLGIDHKKGSIKKGLDADLVVFDKDINIKCTLAKSEIRK